MPIKSLPLDAGVLDRGSGLGIDKHTEHQSLQAGSNLWTGEQNTWSCQFINSQAQNVNG